MASAVPGAIPAFYSPKHALHAPPVEFLHGRLVPYFEVPQRIENIKHSLLEAGLVSLEAPQGTIMKAELARVHDAEMIDYLENLSNEAAHLVRQDYAMYGMEDVLTGGEYYYEWIFPPDAVRGRAGDKVKSQHFIFDGTAPVGSDTWEAICSAAALAKAGAEALLDGQRWAYAMCRPPGHHAGRNFVGGYCYFNNAAVAADLLLARGEVAVIDIDYHHGNGTQAIFWDEPRVFFGSIHADPLVDYPYYSGFKGETGGSAAEKTNYNIPLPHGVGSDDYMKALSELLERVKDFAPSSVVVSLGFDTYKDDPMAFFRLDVSDYQRIGRLLRDLELPTLFVQEGGYCVDALGDMAVAFFQGVLGIDGEDS